MSNEIIEHIIICLHFLAKDSILIKEHETGT